jgi:hypothetical protein
MFEDAVARRPAPILTVLEYTLLLGSVKMRFNAEDEEMKLVPERSILDEFEFTKKASRFADVRAVEMDVVPGG